MRRVRNSQKWRRRKRASRAAALLLGALCGCLLASASAGASTGAHFTYEMCDSALPGGNTPGVSFAHGPAFTGANSCASPGGSLSIQETATSTGEFAFWSIGIPATPGGFIESIAISAEACGLSPANDDTFVFQGQPSPWPGNSCVESQRSFHLRDAPAPFNLGGSFTILMNCNGNKGPCPSGPTIIAHYFAATQVDQAAPSVSDVQGSLLGGGTIRGHQTLKANLSDKGGGLSEEVVLVNGIATAQHKESCAVAHANNPSIYGMVASSTTPCPSTWAADWNLDTQAYPFRDGSNSIQVCGYDFATVGNPNAGCSAVDQIVVDNSCEPSPVDGGELLSAQFSHSNSETETVGYGHGATITGRLGNGADDPVSGATLCVKMATLGIGAHASGVGSVMTDAEGRYSYAVSPGPNREVVIGYRHDSRQVARDVRFYAHVKPSLRLAPAVLHNGKSVHLWGRLPGPRPGRRVVVIQANAPGSSRWITFRKVTTDGQGAFHTAYRFSSTSRKTRYRFRALVPDQAGYPWVEGHSKPAKVLVKG